MLTKEGINVTVKLGKQTIDLRIPSYVRQARLKHLIREALQVVGMNVPQEFELVVDQKPFVIRSTALIKEYAIGEGDLIEIVTKKSYDETTD